MIHTCIAEKNEPSLNEEVQVVAGGERRQEGERVSLDAGAVVRGGAGESGVSGLMVQFLKI